MASDWIKVYVTEKQRTIYDVENQMQSRCNNEFSIISGPKKELELASWNKFQEGNLEEVQYKPDMSREPRLARKWHRREL